MNTALFLQAAPQQGGGMGFLIMMLAIFVIFWLFMIRPQQKKQKEMRTFQNSLQEGQKVIIGSGIYGKVKRVDHSTGKVNVEIARDVVVEVDKSYVFADLKGMQATTQTK